MYHLGTNRQLTHLSWPKTDFPFERLHIDFAEWKEEHFLVCVDVYSKLIIVKSVRSAAADESMQLLDDIFQLYGFSATLVTDNGPLFQSERFLQFCMRRGIKLINSPPRHPASNGIAEKAVQTVKETLSYRQANKVLIQRSVEEINYALAFTASTVTGLAPASIIFFL